MSLPSATPSATPTATRQQLQAALQSHGLQLRGGWIPQLIDDLPALESGHAIAIVWMVGVVGSGFWPHFSRSVFYRDGLPDALDRWSAEIGNALARQFGGRALFPFDGPPYQPFQRWADRSEATQTSPLLLRLHPLYGLWHAYRFALALPRLAAADAQALAEEHDAIRQTQLQPALCTQCSGQPCLSACPVQAFTGTAYLLESCAAHLHGPSGAACMDGGCRARHACPQGPDYRYTPEHAAFHMQAFVRRH